jgi:hypothetical protein
MIVLNILRMKIKTILTAFGIILISISSIKAQDFKFGLLAGFDISNTRLTNKPDNLGHFMDVDPMITFNLSGYVIHKTTDFWGLSLEPGFMQKGGIKNVDGDKVKFKLNYIHLPSLVDFYLLDKVFVSIGPEFCWMINAKTKSNDHSNYIIDLYDNKFEVSGLVGLNYNIIKQIDVGLRYNHGLTYISKTTWTDEIGNVVGKDSKEYNQYIQLIVRFKI